MAKIIDRGAPLRGEDITGKQYGKLTVQGFAGCTRQNERRLLKMWNCVCSCGTEIAVAHYSLTHGNTSSCGCTRSESLRKRNHRHGHSKHPLYRVWCSMRERCSLPSCTSYADYGGRGIRVSDEWNLSFDSFLSDMGDSWEPGLSLERIENDGPYSKDNCKWATRLEQGSNTRSNVFLSFQGENYTISQWERILGFKTGLLNNRLNRLGWSVEKALSTPQRKFVRQSENQSRVSFWHILSR